MLFLVMLSGTIMLTIPAGLSTEWRDLTWPNAALSVLAGLAFACASLCLYVAFSIGPVRLVAPIIGAYPVLSMAWAVANGATISGLQWSAVLVVVAGVAMVAAFSAPNETTTGRFRAIVFATLAGVAFATTFAASQAAVAGGADLPVIFISRICATIIIGFVLLTLKQPPIVPVTILVRLAGMGVLDACALAFVTISGAFPHPQLAAVSASLFGMLTIVLAWIFLREPMSGRQWIAATIVFCGIGILGFT